MYGDPASNDGWGPDLCGRLLYKDILHSKFCKSVEFHRVYQPNEKVWSRLVLLTVPTCIAPRCTVLHRTVLHHTPLDHTAPILHSTALVSPLLGLWFGVAVAGELAPL